MKKMIYDEYRVCGHGETKMILSAIIGQGYGMINCNIYQPSISMSSSTMNKAHKH